VELYLSSSVFLRSLHRDTLYHTYKRHVLHLKLAASCRPYMLLTSGTNLLDCKKNSGKFEICIPCRGILCSNVSLKG
jgi:hypothetical protein